MGANFFVTLQYNQTDEKLEKRNLILKTQPKTALVTGPTSGIGEAFARQLAQAGYDLVLVSRSESKLAAMCQKLESQNGINARYIVADLSQPGEPERVFSETQAMAVEVDLLVNNAGTHEYGAFAEADWKALNALMDLLLRSVVHLTHLFLPGMIDRDSGQILNLGSTGSFVAWPKDAIYGASKAFILKFSEALAAELRHTRVGVTCLCPGVVETAFLENGNLDQTILSRLTAMQPEPVVQSGLRAMRSRKWVRVPGVINKLIIFFQRFVPRRLLTRIAEWATTPAEYRSKSKQVNH
jgi:short-subunit dehydrogenase